MTIEKRFLLVCHDRSGSNLLKGMLGQHPEVYVIPPLPIFEIIYYYQGIYGDLSADENWDALLRDVAALYDANHHPLPHPISLDELRERAVSADRTLGGAVATVFDILGEKVGRPILGLKFGAYHGMMTDFFEQSRFEAAVFQYRDPRDVALSAYKAGVDGREPETFVQHWLEWHRAVRQITQDAGMPLIEHRYEDLLYDPEGVLGRIWDFLEVEPCDGALNFYKSEDQKKAANTSYMWQNVAKPLQSDNKEKFYAEWGLRRTRSIERAATHAGLEEFGYRPAALLRFPLRAMLPLPAPVRRVRTEKDKEFQRRQNEIAADIRRRWDGMTARTQLRAGAN